jgi:hypothetical protein
MLVNPLRSASSKTSCNFHGKAGMPVEVVSERSLRGVIVVVVVVGSGSGGEKEEEEWLLLL